MYVFIALLHVGKQCMLY